MSRVDVDQRRVNLPPPVVKGALNGGSGSPVYQPGAISASVDAAARYSTDSFASVPRLQQQRDDGSGVNGYHANNAGAQRSWRSGVSGERDGGHAEGSAGRYADVSISVSQDGNLATSASRSAFGIPNGGVSATYDLNGPTDATKASRNASAVSGRRRRNSSSGTLNNMPRPPLSATAANAQGTPRGSDRANAAPPAGVDATFAPSELRNSAAGSKAITVLSVSHDSAPWRTALQPQSQLRSPLAGRSSVNGATRPANSAPNGARRSVRETMQPLLSAESQTVLQPDTPPAQPPLTLPVAGSGSALSPLNSISTSQQHSQPPSQPLPPRRVMSGVAQHSGPLSRSASARSSGAETNRPTLPVSAQRPPSGQLVVLPTAGRPVPTTRGSESGNAGLPSPRELVVTRAAPPPPPQQQQQLSPALPSASKVIHYVARQPAGDAGVSGAIAGTMMVSTTTLTQSERRVRYVGIHEDYDPRAPDSESDRAAEKAGLTAAEKAALMNPTQYAQLVESATQQYPNLLLCDKPAEVDSMGSGSAPAYLLSDGNRWVRRTNRAVATSTRDPAGTHSRDDGSMIPAAPPGTHSTGRHDSRAYKPFAARQVVGGDPNRPEYLVQRHKQQLVLGNELLQDTPTYLPPHARREQRRQTRSGAARTSPRSSSASTSSRSQSAADRIYHAAVTQAAQLQRDQNSQVHQQLQQQQRDAQYEQQQQEQRTAAPALPPAPPRRALPPQQSWQQQDTRYSSAGAPPPVRPAYAPTPQRPYPTSADPTPLHEAPRRPASLTDTNSSDSFNSARRRPAPPPRASSQPYVLAGAYAPTQQQQQQQYYNSQYQQQQQQLTPNSTSSSGRFSAYNHYEPSQPQSHARPITETVPPPAVPSSRTRAAPPAHRPSPASGSTTPVSATSSAASSARRAQPTREALAAVDFRYPTPPRTEPVGPRDAAPAVPHSYPVARRQQQQQQQSRQPVSATVRANPRRGEDAYEEAYSQPYSASGTNANGSPVLLTEQQQQQQQQPYAGSEGTSSTTSGVHRPLFSGANTTVVAGVDARLPHQPSQPATEYHARPEEDDEEGRDANGEDAEEDDYADAETVESDRHAYQEEPAREPLPGSRRGVVGGMPPPPPPPPPQAAPFDTQETPEDAGLSHTRGRAQISPSQQQQQLSPSDSIDANTQPVPVSERSEDDYTDDYEEVVKVRPAQLVIDGHVYELPAGQGQEPPTDLAAGNTTTSGYYYVQHSEDTGAAQLQPQGHTIPQSAPARVQHPGGGVEEDEVQHSIAQAHMQPYYTTGAYRTAHPVGGHDADDADAPEHADLIDTAGHADTETFPYEGHNTTQTTAVRHDREEEAYSNDGRYPAETGGDGLSMQQDEEDEL